ncbi:hypothetical protein J8F10_26510 [Gemmata sp. G18]|uniref:DUF4064 domain-containing protein n=1 Tax=Gemmata palustris TaxID=2822762 RepID=A0ABS5BYM9_9BACT|nr:hypothetical protein [Gemmata palustris]MBP3958814.1 hypothetical protein [Gemmata palustris]
MSRDPRDDYYRDDPDRDDRESDFGEDDRGDRDERAIRRAKSKVMAPAIGLIVVAVFGFLSVALGIVQFATLDAQFDEEVKKVEQNPGIPDAQKKDQIQLLNQFRDWAKIGWIPFYAMIGVFSVITLIGGVKLMSLSGKFWPIAGSVLALLPCTSGCCFLGLVFGIWALVIIGQPDVKAGFAARRRAAYSPDRY